MTGELIWNSKRGFLTFPESSDLILRLLLSLANRWKAGDSHRGWATSFLSGDEHKPADAERNLVLLIHVLQINNSRSQEPFRRNEMSFFP